MAAAIALSIPASPVARERLGLPEKAAPVAPVAPVALAAAPPEVTDIIVGRCSMCHGSTPVWRGLAIAPKGVLLDTPELIERWRQEVRLHSGYTRAMPPNNLTEMTEEERAIVRAWGAPARKAASLQ
jgi:uncharacterized membrane protein